LVGKKTGLYQIAGGKGWAYWQHKEERGTLQLLVASSLRLEDLKKKRSIEEKKKIKGRSFLHKDWTVAMEHNRKPAAPEEKKGGSKSCIQPTSSSGRKKKRYQTNQTGFATLRQGGREGRTAKKKCQRSCVHSDRAGGKKRGD